ncbi:uncharacterized protein LOC130442140 [Diorhabda sublineata]|uniref:uncharacterized protein LOC130442140 n=1 Tax=Diorhabda sublineata TaxID=1163346 RepID=UPI0024E10735|nr:uncharacterized protein LOC130442140 [Diorhabda sublineata]
MYKLIPVIFILSALQFTSCIDITDFGPNLMKDYKRIHDNCVALTGATDGMIGEVKDGVFNDENDIIKEYTACIWLNVGVIDSKLNMNLEKMAYYWPSKISPDQISIYASCIKNAREETKLTTTVEKIWGIAKCIEDEIPEDHIFF